MSELIISVSGLRGIVGQSLTPEIAARYAGAFATELDPGPIVVSRDGRSSGPMLADAMQTVLQAAGRDVLDAGVAATPTTGVLVRHHNAAGGIQITASHNPAEYNGLKLFSSQGRVIPEAEGGRVLQRFQSGEVQGNAQGSAQAKPGTVRSIEDSTSAHLALIHASIDAERIRKNPVRVVLDCNHGSGSLLGERLLVELGCQVTLLGPEPDGQFAHVPEPTAENLEGVQSIVTQRGADIGFCQDPDADRLAVIDHAGRYLGEEYTLAMCVDHVLRHRKGPIVTNLSTSRMCEDLADKHGVPFHRSRVGEANVVDVMQSCGAVLGGEGNGGVIDPRVGWVRDSFISMALLLEAMAERGRRIAELADELPQYSIHKTKVPLAAERLPAALTALEAHFADATADRADGLRLDWPGRWLLVRPSNTEPIVRLVAEAGSAGEAEGLCEAARGVLGPQ